MEYENVGVVAVSKLSIALAMLLSWVGVSCITDGHKGASDSGGIDVWENDALTGSCENSSGGEACGDASVCAVSGTCMSLLGDASGICSPTSIRSDYFDFRLMGTPCSCCDDPGEFYNYSGVVREVAGNEIMFSKLSEDSTPCILYFQLAENTVPLEVGDEISVQSGWPETHSLRVEKGGKLIFLGEMRSERSTWIYSDEHRLGVELGLVDAGCAVQDNPYVYYCLAFPMKLEAQTPTGSVVSIGTGESAMLELDSGSYLLVAKKIFAWVDMCIPYHVLSDYYMVAIP